MMNTLVWLDLEECLELFVQLADYLVGGIVLPSVYDLSVSLQ